MVENYSNRMCRKLEQVNRIYAQLMYEKVDEVDGLLHLQTLEHLREAPVEGLNPLEKGSVWGGEYMNMWIVGSYTVPEELDGKSLWLIPNTDAYETLYFRNGVPCGIFNSKGDYMGIMHSVQPLTDNAKAGDVINIALECYAGHFQVDDNPYNYYGQEDPKGPDYKHRFNSLDVCVVNQDIYDFVFNLNITTQLAQRLDNRNFVRSRARTACEKIFASVIQYPAHYDKEKIQESVKECNEIMRELLKKGGNDTTHGKVGIIGSSHLDTAWLWPVSETIRKAARTFSNVCTLMDRYPEYKFIQSSALHLDWLREYYPAVFERVSKYIKEGRYEPNGGVWVECDCNITSGELMARQFLYGQLYTRKYFDYTADSFWLPDTFGYNAAIPQIMQESEVRYFYTTKMGWNDLNRFPFTTFRWKGIDGTEVITHLHRIDTSPDVNDVVGNIEDISNKQGFERKLLPFGHGDGGGGPTPAMLEKARRIKDVEGLPETYYTTVSDFMKSAEEVKDQLPEYTGELYLELHRGTLTQMHDIKRTNRKCEIALHDMDYFNVLAGKVKDEATDRLYKVLLTNQFHDILPGTCYTGVTQKAVAENLAAIEEAKEITHATAGRFVSGKGFTFFNTTSFDRDDCIVIDDTGVYPEGCVIQKYTDLSGKAKIFVGGVQLDGLCARSFKATDKPLDAASAFSYEGGVLTTPHAVVRFDENGGIASFFDRDAERELRRQGAEPLNTFYTGEDVPNAWDNWDIDYETMLKIKPQKELTSFTVVSDGPIAFVIRASYKIGTRSSITQDIIFYADNPRVDFNTVIDWNDKHTLLKTGFDVDINSLTVKNEIQFGHIDRPTTENNQYEAAKFEVCNHKWSDLSESRYGVAILNDCKYGISADGSNLRLTLHKSGTHPDVTGDKGVHEVTYSFLPHNSSFSADSVIKPAYLLNYPVICENGVLEREMKPVVATDCDNIVCEAIKPAELRDDAFVARFYEAERCRTNAKIYVGEGVKHVYRTNILEDIKSEMEVRDGAFSYSFRPFEIATFMFVK